MSRVEIIGFGAVSALGECASAASAGPIGRRARVVIAHDPELAQAGLARPFVARWCEPVSSGPEGDLRAEALLERALSGCASELDRVRTGWRRERVGMVLGTSSGGMRCAERAFEAIARGERIADVEVLSVRRERLDAITPADVTAEGFPQMTTAQFIAFFCRSHRGCQPGSTVTRIEWRYLG